MFLIYLAIVCLFAFEKLLFGIFYVFSFRSPALLDLLINFAAHLRARAGQLRVKKPISLCEKEFLAVVQKFCLFRVPCKIMNNSLK